MKTFITVLLLCSIGFYSAGCNYRSIEPKRPDQISGLVGYWKFDGDAKDSSGNNNHGTWVGGAAYKEGVFGEAADFSSPSGSYVTVPHSPSINVGAGAFSFGAWVNSYGNIGKNQHLLNKRTGGDRGSFWDIYLSSLAENINAEVTGKSFGNPPSKMGTNTWYHIMLTRASDGLVTIYIDGEYLASANLPGDSSSTHAFNIGNLTVSPDHEFNGLIDEVVIYDRELEAGEVGALYEAGLKAFGY